MISSYVNIYNHDEDAATYDQGCLDLTISFSEGKNRVLSLYEHTKSVAIFNLRRIFLPTAVWIPRTPVALRKSRFVPNSAFILSRFQPQDAGEVAAFLNELRQQSWSLTSLAYQRKPEHVPLVTAEALLQEQREHLHRIGHYILRYKDHIIASMKIDDKFGDGQVAVCAELETHPSFQRRGIPWFRLLPCVRQVIEMEFQWIELVTWVFNRKGLPLYKRCGFRAVPGTSLLMENYLPLIIRHPILQPYFQRHDYIKTLVNKRSYGYDHLQYHDLYVF